MILFKNLYTECLPIDGRYTVFTQGSFLHCLWILLLAVLLIRRMAPLEKLFNIDFLALGWVH